MPLSLDPPQLEQPIEEPRRIFHQGADFNLGGGFIEDDAQREQFESVMPKIDLGRGSRFGAGAPTQGTASSSQSASQAKSVPGLLGPNIGDISTGFDTLQGGIQTNTPQERAVSLQQGLGDTLQDLLGGAGEGQRARINQQFDTASKNVAGSISSRGFGGSSLNQPAQLSVEAGRQGALSGLEDQLLGARSDAASGTAKQVSDLLFGAGGQATNLLGGILGSMGIGNFAQSQDESVSSSATAPKFSLGGGGSSGGGGGNGIGGVPRLGPYNPGSGSPTGGTSSGGGAGATSGGGGGAVINNPFVAPQGGVWQDDPQSQDGIPLEDQELEEDQGPLQTPEAFERNQKRLDAQDAKTNQMLQSLQGQQPSASNTLAQSAGGTSGMIDAGAALA